MVGAGGSAPKSDHNAAQERFPTSLRACQMDFDINFMTSLGFIHMLSLHNLLLM